jgi:O-acetyl-ADP-ribose deacetylase (regulator of RNase III)
MILTNSDLLSVTKGVIVHGCNCNGGFGSGIAGQIAKRYPQVRNRFMQNGTGKQLLGTINVGLVLDDLYIINAYTQETYGSKPNTKYASPLAISSALFRVLLDYSEEEIHVPKIGCGLGGLTWTEEVMPIYSKIEDETGRELIVHYV